MLYDCYVYMQLCSLYGSQGYVSGVNVPWSGREGFMYAADSVSVQPQHAHMNALMLEFRQDLLQQPEWRQKTAAILANFIKQHCKLP